jgi:hypothetical protein
MKKETITAVTLGIMLGIAVAVFVDFRAKENQLSKNKPINGVNKVTPSIAKKNEEAIVPLQITEPSDGIIVSSKSIKIKGKVNKDSLIIIQSPIKDMVLKTDSDTFDVDYPLAMGENAIELTVYSKDKNLGSFQKELKIYSLDEQ